ncbi:hypothetical protein [Ornithinimicrobium faecis]|uniref:hypothetical protein n=1 Tax=Ornithinimicrobium faecis TaxID=2934158 RepID=UPI0021190AF4|nr:hypothetical protein [Ornithinimicrobium sp. HY1745]
MSPSEVPREPHEVVVRLDRARYRRFMALRWTIAVLVVGALLVGAALVDTSERRGWIIASAVIVGAVAVAVLLWHRRTYLDPEPALVLGTAQFRILHKRRHLWVPWTDVESVRLTTMMVKGQDINLLRFDLLPEARWKLPPEPAPLVDRMMLWRTNDLVYSRPCETPRIEEVERIAQRLHDQATGGHRLRPAQRPSAVSAHWPEDRREAGS